MGVLIEIDGESYEAINYQVSEESTPLSSDDSSGSVGDYSFDLVEIEDPYLLQGKDVRIHDTSRGTTVGFISGISDGDSGIVQITCQSRLGRLNVYGVQAKPFIGTLGNAFRYYAGLARQTTGIQVDSQINNRPVVFPGFHGELWFFLKQMVSAQGCEIALVEGDIWLRPIRQFVAEGTHFTSKSRTYGGTNLAETVEVIHYNNRQITLQPVYPPGGFTLETEVLTFNAGETVTRDIELMSSLSSFETPEHITELPFRDYNATSVYTVLGNDGFPVSPANFTRFGGRVSFRLNEDTKSIQVTMRGPRGIPSTSGGAVTTFSLANPAGDSETNWYSTLRIRGTGVAFDPQTVSFRTLVPASQTGTEVGTTVDNIFLSSLNEAYNAGGKAATVYAGNEVNVSGNATHIGALVDGVTEVPVFGNVAGSRLWDERTRRWYRVRNGGVSRDSISLNGDDDLTVGDLDDHYLGLTMGQIDTLFAGRTMQERDRLGLYGI